MSAVREERGGRFCFQYHDALAAIRAGIPASRLSTALAVYLCLTEAANNNGGKAARSGFQAARKEIAELAGISVDTLDRYVKDLVEVGVVQVETKKVGKVNLPNVWLLTDPPSRIDAATVAAPERHLARDPSREEITTKKESATHSLAGPPKVTRIDGRDIAFDTLREECGIAADDTNQAKRVAVALNGKKGHVETGIREMVWVDVVARYFDGDAARAYETLDRGRFETGLCQAIRAHADAYRRAWPDRDLTPIALATWWKQAEVRADAAPKRGMTPEEMETYGTTWGPGTGYETLAEAKAAGSHPVIEAR